jgi:hypothetical protein
MYYLKRFNKKWEYLSVRSNEYATVFTDNFHACYLFESLVELSKWMKKVRVFGLIVPYQVIFGNTEYNDFHKKIPLFNLDYLVENKIRVLKRFVEEH